MAAGPWGRGGERGCWALEEGRGGGYWPCGRGGGGDREVAAGPGGGPRAPTELSWATLPSVRPAKAQRELGTARPGQEAPPFTP